MTVQPPEVEIDESVLEDLDNEWDIVCDYSDTTIGKFSGCSGAAAEWIARWRCQSCGASGARCICAPCKDMVMLTPHACMCSSCGDIVAPFRAMFVYFTPLRAT